MQPKAGSAGINQVNSIDPAMPPIAARQRRRDARAIRVHAAYSRAAGGRLRALGQRKIGAILDGPSPKSEMHAYRKSGIIRLSPSAPSCQNHSGRQNRQNQNAHRNLLVIASISARRQTGHLDRSQFKFSRDLHGPPPCARMRHALNAPDGPRLIVAAFLDVGTHRILRHRHGARHSGHRG